jgi:circadian clock protein KaiC
MSTTNEEAEDSGIVRLASGVPGLDAVLCGGFLRGGLYIIQGPPGSGKTILANQIAYYSADHDDRAIFITVLGENHARMMLHLRSMRFFDLSRIPDQIAYIGAYRELEEGLQGLLTLIRREIQARGATLLVLDGLSAVAAQADSEFAMKRFAHELQTLASMLDCTMLLLTSAAGVAGAPERTMVDGIVELQHRPLGARRERRLVVQKFRGSDFLEGEHPYRITREGLTVFPRIEAMLAWPSLPPSAPQTRISSGVASLDRMFGTGIPAAATAENSPSHSPSDAG